MEALDNSLQIAPNALGENRHVCAFFNSIDEQHRVLRSFIKDGFGGLLQENPFYVAPDQFLLEIRKQRSPRVATSTAQ
jgi:hypothetical protein